MSISLVTLTGPSGSGKTTVLDYLVGQGQFFNAVSHTTRPPRPGEVNGRDYHFVDSITFRALLAERAFAEHVTFKGYEYGVSHNSLIPPKDSGLTPVVIVEPNGLHQLINSRGSATILKVYLTCDKSTLISRYLSRLDPKDLENAEKLKYHGVRINSIVEEHDVWGNDPVVSFDIRSRQNDVRDLETLGELVIQGIKNKQQGT